MSSTIILPDPCLVALLLVCQTRSGSGPQLVYTWPPNPLSDIKSSRSHDNTATDEDADSSDDSEAWSSDDDLVASGTERKSAYSSWQPLGTLSNKFERTRSEHQTDTADSKERILLGLDEDGLVGLLAPDRSWNKRKFEMSINDLTFVGRPIFAKTNGVWRRRKKTKTPKPQMNPGGESSTEEETETEALHPSSTQASCEPDAKSELSMFHLVFVLKPPPLEHHHRVKEMYDNIIKKFSKALKWVQAKHDYVWSEVQTLLAERQRLASAGTASSRSVLEALAESSSLARAIVTVFNSISASRIAAVGLSPGVTLTLQIPPVTSTAYLPSLTEPSLPPGLWLTTATETQGQGNASERQTPLSQLQLAKSHTLLLKSPPHRIARDAQAADDDMAANLPRFVAALRPTKSFYKLSVEHNISLNHITVLASHLIYYRRAVMIPPLNQGDTYILSPNADFRIIREACKNYEAQFPSSLPSLPKVLGFLSGIPCPFRELIPSPDHKEIYMLLLAWLMRHGWVTQLRTFAYIRVGSDIKQQARNWERETRTSVSQSFSSGHDTKADDIRGPTRPSFVSRQSSDGRQSIKNGQSDKMTSLILSPPRATPEESRWLRYLQESILDGSLGKYSQVERDELYQQWPTLSRHFDGITALETIATREGYKRQKVGDLLAKLGLDSDRGVEGKDETNDSILVTFRHW